MKKLICEKCKTTIKRDDLYVPTRGKWKYKKLCKECFEIALNNIFNGGKR